MIDLGNSTNLTADEAASQLAKFANIMQMSQKDFSKLGSSIVDLGNHFATTEADIVAMAMRLAGAGKQVGLSEGQVLGLATALSSVGIEAEMGGSAISKAMVKMQNAVEQGGTKLNTVLKKTGMTLRSLELMSANDSMGFKELSQSIGMTSTELKQLITAGANLEDFAKVSGMTTEQFKKAWKEDAAGALSAFIKGLGDAESKGESAITMLSEMGLTEVRLRDSLLRAANAGNLFNDAINTGTKAWEDNTALTNEANKRYDTLKSKITIAINKVKDLAITFGNKMKPTLDSAIKTVEKLTNWISNLTDKQVELILKIGATVTAIGPLITILGKITSVGGSVIKNIGIFTQAIGVMKGSITSTSTAVNRLVKIMSPTSIAITGIVTVATGLKIAMENATKETKAFAKEMNSQKQSLDEYNKKIDETTSSNFAQIDSVDKLKESLKTLVDENGKIKEGYEGRVSFILNQLNNALDTEYKLNGDIVDGYKELQTEIEKTIEKKKAEIILNGEEEKYKNAIKNQTQAVEDLKKAHEELGISVEDAKVKLQKLKDEAMLQANGVGTIDFWTAKEITNLENLINSYDDAEYKVKEYTSEVKKYEEDYALFAEGKYNEIGNIISKNTKQWCDSTLKEIKDSINKQSKSLKIYEKIYKDTGNKIALQNAQQTKKNLDELSKELLARTSTVENLGQEEIDAWKDLAENSFDTYYDTISPLDEVLRKKIQDMTGVVAERTPELVEETRRMSQEVLNEIEKNPEFKRMALDNLRGMLDGLQDNELRELLKQAGVQDVDKVMQGIREGNLGSEQGKEILSKLYDGLNNKNWKSSIYNTARNISSNLSKLLTVKATVEGASLSFSALTKALPGHKNGLDYVPKDDYVARLHKGERVLTKEENKAYSEAEDSSRRSNQSNISFATQIDYNKMANAMLKALTGCKFSLEEDGIARIVKDELYKVV